MMNATELLAFLTKNNLSFSPADDKGANTNWETAVEKKSAVSHNHNRQHIEICKIAGITLKIKSQVIFLGRTD